MATVTLTVTLDSGPSVNNVMTISDAGMTRLFTDYKALLSLGTNAAVLAYVMDRVAVQAKAGAVAYERAQAVIQPVT